MNTPIPTPLTDAEADKMDETGVYLPQVVPAAFARLLERRLQTLANIVWDARWGQGQNPEHDEQLDFMVSVAAEVRSGNFESLDKNMPVST